MFMDDSGPKDCEPPGESLGREVHPLAGTSSAVGVRARWTRTIAQFLGASWRAEPALTEIPTEGILSPRKCALTPPPPAAKLEAMHAQRIMNSW